MRNLIAVTVAVAGSCTAALSQDLTRLTYEVSSDGQSWSSNVVTFPGQQVQVRVRATYLGTGTVGGLNYVIFQPTISNWLGANAAGNGASGDNLVVQSQGSITDTIGPYGGTRTTPMGSVSDVPGAYGRISPFASTSNNSTSYYRGFVGAGPNAGLLRISQAHITNWMGEGPTAGSSSINNFSGRGGVVAGQLAGVARISTDPAFNSGSDVVVFKFALVLGSNPSPRTLNVTTPNSGLGRLVQDGVVGAITSFWYANATDFASVSGGVQVVGATINSVPAPGTLLLGFGVLVSSGRRRRVS